MWECLGATDRRRQAVSQWHSVNEQGATGMSGEQTVVVTGVSTGIGWGSCKVLLSKGFTVFGSVRRARVAEHSRYPHRHARRDASRAHVISTEGPLVFVMRDVSAPNGAFFETGL